MIFNTLVFDSGMFDGGTTIGTSYSTDTLVFENFSLSDGTVMVLTRLRISGPSREIIGGPVPRDHGEYITADYFREFTIEATGILKQSTAATLDAYIDTVKKSLRTREGNLDYIDANGTVRRFVATVDNFDEMFAGREPTDITKVPWTVRFKCKTPFSKSRDYTSVFDTISTSPTTEVVVHSGTTKAQPVVILNFTAANTVTVVNVKRVDAAGTTLDEIEYSGTIAANDLFIFDSEAKTVTKNGTQVNYTGSFPSLDVGSNLIKVTVTATSFTAETTIKHKTTYL